MSLKLTGRDVEVWGRNAVVGTAFEDLNPYDLTIDWPTILPSAAKLDVSSSSAQDAFFLSKGTATMTIAAPGVVTLSAHGLVSGDAVKFTTDGALPTGVTADTTYYANKVNANTFKLAPTQADSIAGTNLITTSGEQSGTHTLFGPGTGANIIRKYGIDGSFHFITEDVLLNGTTVVTTTKEFLRQLGEEILRTGTGGTNAGAIYSIKTGTSAVYTTPGVPDTLTSAVSKMLIGYGASENGMFTVPAGKIARLKGVLFTARAQACTFQIVSQKLDDPTDNGLKVDSFPVEVSTSGSTYISAEALGMIHEWKEKTDIRMRALAAGASGIATGVMFLELTDA